MQTTQNHVPLMGKSVAPELWTAMGSTSLAQAVFRDFVAERNIWDSCSDEDMSDIAPQRTMDNTKQKLEASC